MIINTVAEIEALNLSNEYHVNSLLNELQMKRLIERFHPCTLMLNDENRGQLLLDVEKKIYINQDYKGKWVIYQSKHYANLDGYGLARVRESLEAPKNFKVLSAKNITNWLNYCQQFDKLAEEASLNATVKTIEYLAKVDEMVKKGCKLQLHSDGRSGYLTKGQIELSFEIQNNGSVSQNVRLNGVYTIEDFDKLLNS